MRARGGRHCGVTRASTPRAQTNAARDSFVVDTIAIVTHCLIAKLSDLTRYTKWDYDRFSKHVTNAVKHDVHANQDGVAFETVVAKI